MLLRKIKKRHLPLPRLVKKHWNQKSDMSALLYACCNVQETGFLFDQSMTAMQKNTLAKSLAFTASTPHISFLSPRILLLMKSPTILPLCVAQSSGRFQLSGVLKCCLTTSRSASSWKWQRKLKHWGSASSSCFPVIHNVQERCQCVSLQHAAGFFFFFSTLALKNYLKEFPFTFFE